MTLPVEQIDQPRGGVRKIGRMTESAFVRWCDADTRAEWVDGEVLLMSPVDFGHSDLATFLSTVLRTYVDEYELGKVVGEPFQVRFKEQRRRRSPDIQFISNARLGAIAGTHIEGGPDLVIEVVSPESQSRDRREKYEEYQRGSVREYWIVDPVSQTVEVYAASRGGKFKQIAEKEGRVSSRVVPGFYVKPEWLWRSKLPKVGTIVRELMRRK